VPSAKIKMRIESKAIAALAGRLAEIDRKIARKALKAGINEVSKAVLWDAKSLVPKRTGLLRKSLGRKIKSYRNGAVIVGIIGPRKGFRLVINGVPVNPVKYAHLVEFGRREVRPKKKKVLAGSGIPVAGKASKQMGPYRQVIFGKRVRSVAPRPFLRPAWEHNKARAVGVIIQALHAALRGIYRRAKSRAGTSGLRKGSIAA
jgi:HK97 gp10 family phage protein